jgi:hypothetical protein
MWSLETLAYLNEQASKKARRQRKEPFVPTLDEIDSYPPFPFPHLGSSFVPPGWEQVEDALWFADSSGWGRDDEPALSVRQLKNELRHYIKENPGHGFGIVECGQFQCYVAAFRRVEATDKAA